MEQTKLPPESLYERGFTDLVSVIPPGAQLSPTSKLDGASLGKVPGLRKSSGLWAGYDWRKHEPTIDDARKWAIDGANIGLRADRFPAVDIDVLDERLAQMIEDAALTTLGRAPLRVGRWPKRLLMYRTKEPFGRMRLWINHGENKSLVEILGQGQQFVVYGQHPATGRGFAWRALHEGRETTADDLTFITREQADAFIVHLANIIDSLGLGSTTREGDGKPLTRTAGDPDALEAPNLDALRDAVRCIPNNIPDRSGYIRMGYAIRAAAGIDEPEGFSIFAEWASKWGGNDRFPRGNDPETVLADWRRIPERGSSVGWPFIAEQARTFGYNDAAHEFAVEDEAPTEAEVGAPFLSDQWLALKIVERRRADIRYVPSQGRFLVWDSARYNPDADLLAEDLIKTELRKIAAEVEKMGATPKEQRDFGEKAVAICSAAKAGAVRGLIQSDRGIAVSAGSLDHDPWLLNTPSGMVDLKTGQVFPADPDQLCTRATSVPADFTGACPEWKRFLREATGDNPALEVYLQKLAGYALTGSTREQHLTFVWGPGGNGKSVLINALVAILGDYARTASMDVFTASQNERHTTDIAMLQGARLVTASETQAGKRWDEARVKSMTGGEPITARFMRQDNFTFQPQFKLVFVGNHKPSIRDIDPAMKRRIHLVPFTVEPKQIDNELAAKLREEYPAILAWMVEGCLRWQREGLTPPPIVLETTAEYFSDEDAVGRWLDECCEVGTAGTHELTLALFESWREWANRNGEYPGSVKRLSAALIAKKIEKWRDPLTRRMGFAGIRVREPVDRLLVA